MKESEKIVHTDGNQVEGHESGSFSGCGKLKRSLSDNFMDGSDKVEGLYGKLFEKLGKKFGGHCEGEKGVKSN